VDSDGIVDTSNLSTAFDRFLAQSGRPNLAQARGPYLTAFGIPPALWPLASFGLQAQSRGCVQLVGVKGGLRNLWFVKKWFV